MATDITEREPTDEQIIQAAVEGRLKRADWGRATLVPGGAHTGEPAARIAADRVRELTSGDRPTLVLVGDLYASVCKAAYGVGDGTTAICLRLAGHPPVSQDGIGHSPRTDGAA